MGMLKVNFTPAVFHEGVLQLAWAGLHSVCDQSLGARRGLSQRFLHHHIPTLESIYYEIHFDLGSKHCQITPSSH